MQAKIDEGYRGLEVDGLGKFFHRPLEAQPLQGKTGGVLGQVKELLGGGIAVIKVLTHAHVLRTLSGKKKNQFRHGLIPFSVFHFSVTIKLFNVNNIAYTALFWWKQTSTGEMPVPPKISFILIGYRDIKRLLCPENFGGQCPPYIITPDDK
jgi:hypothetical protein